MGSIAIGLIAGGACALATAIKGKVRIDDSLDVGAVHLVGGVLGALLIGWFGTKDTGGVDGVFYGGGFSLLGKQAEAVVVVVAYSFVVSFAIAKAIDWIMGMRITEAQEIEGMDSTLHGETGYEFGAGLGSLSGTSGHAMTATQSAGRQEVNA